MKIAILASLDIAFGARRVIAYKKQCLRLVARMQLATHQACWSEQFYPLYVVVVCHRMGCTAHTHPETTFHTFNYRHMLLVGSVSLILTQQLHWLATA